MHVRFLGLLSLFPSAACFSAAPSDPPVADGTSGGSIAIPTDGACPDPADKSDANFTTPSVSLANDVLPIFQKSCGLGGATCHGDPTVHVQGRPFLGYPNGGTSSAQVAQVLVAVASTEDPKMALVTAGNLDQSYLWQKLDNLQCKLASDCKAGPSAYPDCGQAMPFGNPTLDDGKLNTIARWIVQGANNN
jgi:hypothetical protein